MQKLETVEIVEPLEITILMPCLNEAETIAVCIDKATSYLESRGIRGEVVVADNGSTDGSQALAERHGARVVPIERRGYGAALLGGIQAARGTFVIMGDADDSYDFSALDPFVHRLRAGADLVMGNRFAGGIERNAMPALHRYLGNPVLTGIGRLLYRSPIRDFHCGLRGFKRASFLQLGLTSPGMEFASEMVVKATLRKLAIDEVPTTLSPDGRSRAPHLRSWRDGWRHLRFLLLMSPAWLFFYPGLALFLFGAAVMVWLLPGTRTAGGVSFDVNTLVFAAAAIEGGLQAILFYVFAKAHGIRSGLLPEDPIVRRLIRMLRLEKGLIAGGVALLAGLALGAYAVGFWGNRSFGPLDPELSLRIVVPSATLIMAGLQLVFSSCLLSILQMETRTSATRSRKTDRVADSQPPARTQPSGEIVASDAGRRSSRVT
jgi:glycosyltransferase involved in cell wall biosynthesis